MTADEPPLMVFCWPNIVGACEDEQWGHYCTGKLGHRGDHHCPCGEMWEADEALEAAVRSYSAFYSTPAVPLHPNAPDQPSPHIPTRRGAVAACLSLDSPWRAVAEANQGDPP